MTGRPLCLYDAQGERVEIAADPRYVGLVAVADHRKIEDDEGHVFSLNVRSVREVKGMPEREDGTVYVLPVDIAMALPDRDDVVYHAEDVDVRPADGQARRISHLRRIAFTSS